MNFTQKVLSALKKIPRGKVATYKQIACAIGSPKAARAVGSACGKNPEAPITPCHRVVRNNSALGGYARGVKRKKLLLEQEGIKVKNNKIVNFKEKLVKQKELEKNA